MARWFWVSLVLVMSSCGGDKRKVNDPCSNNTDCADNICHAGICCSSSPLTSGATCSGAGECRSLSCTTGKCADGQSTGACLYNEECAAKVCANSQCGAANPGQLDGTWKWMSATCDGKPIDFGTVMLTYVFTGTTGKTVTTFTDKSCAQTNPFTVSYPSTNNVIITAAGVATCEPTGCSACRLDPVNQVHVGTFTIEGNTATVTIPKTPADSWGCASALEVIVLQKQP